MLTPPGKVYIQLGSMNGDVFVPIGGVKAMPVKADGSSDDVVFPAMKMTGRVDVVGVYEEQFSGEPAVIVPLTYPTSFLEGEDVRITNIKYG